MAVLGGERAAVQNPFIRYAQDAGWTYLSRDEALRLRHGDTHLLLHLIGLRRQTLAFASNDTEILETGNGHVFGYLRRHENGQILVLASFSEHEQVVPQEMVRRYGERLVDLVRKEPIGAGESPPPGGGHTGGYT